MMETIRILVADDHPIVREGLRALIGTEPRMVIVAEAIDGAEAVQKALLLQPDVILMDLVMPRKDGITAIGEIKQGYPEARILVLTSFAEDEKILPAVKAGAVGYLLKDSSPSGLLEAIREVYDGEAPLHPAVARRLNRELNRPAPAPQTEQSLTTRELEIINLVGRGLSNQEIADRLVLSERTVRTHVSSILSKLHLASRTQAALYAVRKGIASLDSA